jgi:hypothetical protein
VRATTRLLPVELTDGTMSTDERARHELYGRLADVLGTGAAAQVRTFMLATSASILTTASLAFAAARFA